MPRYHFHIVNDVEVFDTKGMALPDEIAARKAKHAARTFRRNWRGKQFKIRVIDERGQTVYEARPDEES